MYYEVLVVGFVYLVDEIVEFGIVVVFVDIDVVFYCYCYFYCIQYCFYVVCYQCWMFYQVGVDYVVLDLVVGVIDVEVDFVVVGFFCQLCVGC